MDCPDLTRLSRYANGLLEPDEDADALRAHVAACASCTERAARLSAAFAFPQEVEPPAHVLPALLRTIGERLTQQARDNTQGVGGETRVVMDQEEPVALLPGRCPSSARPASIGAIGTQSDEALPALPPVTSASERSAAELLDAPAPEEPPADNAWEDYGAEAPPEVVGDVEPEPVAVGAETTDDPGVDAGPKTISQQDAEDIIRRITTKKLLPEPRVAEPEKPALRPRDTGWGRMAAVIPLFLGAALMFGIVAKDEIGTYLPEPLQALFGVKRVELPVETSGLLPVKTKDVILEQKVRAKVLESEWRAFGYASREEFEADRKTWAATPKGDDK